MAVAEPKVDVPGITRPMTYEAYLSGPEEMARCDMIDGWKVYRLYGDKQWPNPTRQHQQIQGNLYLAFRRFVQEKKQEQAIMSPCDVLITCRQMKHWVQPTCAGSRSVPCLCTLDRTC